MSVETLAVEAREQLRRVLNGCEMHEAAALRWALLEGRIDGRRVWNDALDCGCVLGTLARASGAEMDAALDAVERWRGPQRVALDLEAFAYPISPGDKADLAASTARAPRTVGLVAGYGPARAAELVRWIDEWMSERSVSA